MPGKRKTPKGHYDTKDLSRIAEKRHGISIPRNVFNYWAAEGAHPGFKKAAGKWVIGQRFGDEFLQRLAKEERVKSKCMSLPEVAEGMGLKPRTLNDRTYPGHPYPIDTLIIRGRHYVRPSVAKKLIAEEGIKGLGSPGKAAKALGVSNVTIYNWTKRGYISVAKTVHQTDYYDLAHLRENRDTIKKKAADTARENMLTQNRKRTKHKAQRTPKRDSRPRTTSPKPRKAAPKRPRGTKPRKKPKPRTPRKKPKPKPSEPKRKPNEGPKGKPKSTVPKRNDNIALIRRRKAELDRERKPPKTKPQKRRREVVLTDEHMALAGKLLGRPTTEVGTLLRFNTYNGRARELGRRIKQTQDPSQREALSKERSLLTDLIEAEAQRLANQ
jgi:hypothetical protein